PMDAEPEVADKKAQDDLMEDDDQFYDNPEAKPDAEPEDEPEDGQENDINQLLEDDDSLDEEPDIEYGINDHQNNLVNTFKDINKEKTDQILRGTLKDYQVDAFNAFKKGETTKGIYEMFCGLGKSILSFAIFRLNNYDNGIFVFPSIDLI